MTRRQEIARALHRARQEAERCGRPSCVDARRQAARVPGLLAILAVQQRAEAHLESLNQAKRRSVSDLEGKVRALEATQSSLRAEHHRALADGNALSIQLAEAQEQARQGQVRCEALLDELSATRAQLNQAQADVGALRTVAQGHLDALAVCGQRQAQAEGRAFAAEQREKAAQAELSRVRGSLELAIQGNAGMRDRIDALRHDLQVVLAERAASDTAEDVAWAAQEATRATAGRHYPAVRAWDRRREEIHAARERSIWGRRAA